MKIIENKGITLIALVVIIVVLLILTGVSIAMLTGENGILTQAQRAKSTEENAQIEEEKVMENYEQYIEGATNGGTLTEVTGNETSNTEVYDSLGNKILVPAGFRVINPGDNVEDGIIIEDMSHSETKGSQFVWVPVGEFNKKSGNKCNIVLGRYEFEKSSGIPSVYSGIFKESSYGNIEAKNIDQFILKTIEKGGYYIGRYEARTINERNNENDMLTQVSVKPDEFVYNYVTQSQAANLSRNMYEDDNFESDLINSYAWDTTIVFIQNCSERVNYANETSINNFLAKKGTNNLEIKDIVCNIYDMSSNCYEWTTETSTYVSVPCVSRGGSYNDSKNFTSRRNNNSSSRSEAVPSFRPILYFK